MAGKDIALRKRQQIENANRAMFTWVAVAAAVVGMAAVVSVSLFQTMMFKQQVINEKNNTAQTLKDNNDVVDDLKENVRLLNINEALSETERIEGTEPLSVVLDALPAQPNSSALGASLQQKLLNVEGVSIDSLTVEPISGVEDSNESEEMSSGEVGDINFEFSVSAGKSNINSLKKVLLNLEQSIRTIDIESLNVEQQNDTIVLSVEGKAFYKTEVSVELTKKAVP